MRTRMWCVALALLGLSSPAAAQTVLSEADALARLSADSPRVRAIRAGVEVARADVLAVARWPNPRLAVSREAVAGVAEQMWTVTQSIPVNGRRGLEVSAANALVEASTSRADEAIRRARAELRVAYAGLLSAQEREATLLTTRERLRELVTVLERREAAGEGAGYDQLRAARELSDVEADLATARADRARAQGTLSAFFGSGTDAMAAPTLVAVPGGGPPGLLPSAEALVTRAESVRGELLAYQREVDAARFAERAAGRRRIPDPEIVAGAKSSSAGTGDVGSVISLHVAVPLFDRGAPEKALAHARLNQAEAQALAFRAVLRAQVAASRALVLERRDAARRYRDTALPGTDRLERIAQVSYEAGERGILELLDAFRTASTARIRQTELDAMAREAEIELEFVSGWEMP